jgi:hypothetical protein
MKTHTGHILIPIFGNEQHIEPATFLPNGLAVHRDILGRERGYTITHVRSGLALRHKLTRPVAYRAARELAQYDWSFDKDAVTVAHAERVRAAVGNA